MSNKYKKNKNIAFNNLDIAFKLLFKCFEDKSISFDVLFNDFFNYIILYFNAFKDENIALNYLLKLLEINDDFENYCKETLMFNLSIIYTLIAYIYYNKNDEYNFNEYYHKAKNHSLVQGIIINFEDLLLTTSEFMGLMNKESIPVTIKMAENVLKDKNDYDSLIKKATLKLSYIQYYNSINEFDLAFKSFDKLQKLMDILKSKPGNVKFLIINVEYKFELAKTMIGQNKDKKEIDDLICKGINILIKMLDQGIDLAAIILSKDLNYFIHYYKNIKDKKNYKFYKELLDTVTNFAQNKIIDDEIPINW